MHDQRAQLHQSTPTSPYETIVHGAGFEVQGLFSATISPVQQLAFPPGSFPHCFPPQVPQLFAQHAFPLSLPLLEMMPPAFSHCAAAGGRGPGGGGGGGDGGGGGNGGCVTESLGSRKPPPCICIMEHTIRFASASDVGPIPLGKTYAGGGPAVMSMSHRNVARQHTVARVAACYRPRE